MINIKCNCEDEISSRKLAFLKAPSFEKLTLAKKYNCFKKSIDSKKVKLWKSNLHKKVTLTKSSNSKVFYSQLIK